MIFYYAVTNYHILNCILHKLKYHNNEITIIGIPNYHKNCNLLKNNLINSKIFKEVLIINEFDWNSIKNNKDEQIDTDIEKICTDFQKNELDFLKFKEINICGDQNSIGIFLCINKIKYNFFEDGCGVLSAEEKLMNQFKKVNYHRYKILKKVEIPGNNKCVEKRYGDLNCQEKNYYNKKDVHFSIREELDSLDKKDIKRIINIFDAEFENNIKNNSDLLLTWHYVSAGMMTPLEQELYYCTIADYFSKSKYLTIKPHPADSELDYNTIFPNANILSRLLPSELLPCCSNTKFNSLITGYSTSINGLSNFTNKVIDFNLEYDSSYKKMHKYFTITKILEKIIINFKKINVYGIGINEKQFTNLFNDLNLNLEVKEYCHSPKKEKRNGLNVIIIDNINNNEIKKIQISDNENNIIIFINEKNISYFNFENPKLFPVLIKKQINNPKFKEIEEQESYIYIKNITKISTILEKIKFIKKLKYTGVDIQVNTSIQEEYQYVYKYYKKCLESSKFEEENMRLKEELENIKSSKGYNYLIKYWNFINIFKNKVGKKND